jgi:hypothetical protein
VRGPGIQEARGAVLVRSHFEGTGYEQPWTVTGTPTADTLIDPDCTRPEGWPAWAGQPCRFKQLATENAMSISRTIGVADVDTLWYREMIQVGTLPGAAVQILNLYNGDLATTIYMSVANTGSLTMSYHIAAGFVSPTIATVAVGRAYYVEIAYSVSGQWVAYRVNGHLGNKAWTFPAGPIVLDRGGARTLYLRTSTVTTYSIDMYRGGLEVRTDRPPANLRKKGLPNMFFSQSNTLRSSGTLAASTGEDNALPLASYNADKAWVEVKVVFPTFGHTGVKVRLLKSGSAGTNKQNYAEKADHVTIRPTDSLTVTKVIETSGPYVNVRLDNLSTAVTRQILYSYGYTE